MSEVKKRKKSFYKGKYGGKKGRYDNELRSKMKGFILTCNGQEKSATLEGYRLLNKYADKRYGPENKDELEAESDGGEDIEAALKEEVSSIKATANSKERRFQTVQNKAKNVLFIKSTVDKPADLVKDIFDDLLESGEAKTKYCCKLLPVEDTCYAKVDQIIDMAKPLVQAFFTENETSFTYCIMWKTRCNNTIKRDDVYPDLVKLIKEFDKGHLVSYDNPDVVINIDIIGNVCCFGFLRDYHKNGKYNLDTVTKKNSKETQTDTKDQTIEESAKHKDVEEKEEEDLPQKIVVEDKENKDQQMVKEVEKEEMKNN